MKDHGFAHSINSALVSQSLVAMGGLGRGRLFCGLPIFFPSLLQYHGGGVDAFLSFDRFGCGLVECLLFL